MVISSIEYTNKLHKSLLPCNVMKLFSNLASALRHSFLKRLFTYRIWTAIYLSFLPLDDL